MHAGAHAVAKHRYVLATRRAPPDARVGSSVAVGARHGQLARYSGTPRQRPVYASAPPPAATCSRRAASARCRRRLPPCAESAGPGGAWHVAPPRHPVIERRTADAQTGLRRLQLQPSVHAVVLARQGAPRPANNITPTQLPRRRRTGHGPVNRHRVSWSRSQQRVRKPITLSFQ